MKVRDIDYLIIMTALVSICSIVFSGDFVFGGEMMAASLIVGGIVIVIRKGILRAKRNLEEKKQAV